MEINEKEYGVLETWYGQWVRGSGLLATFSFAAIGFTPSIFRFGEVGAALSGPQATLIRFGILLLGASGILSGLNLLVAYLWIDTIRRFYMPSLLGKAIMRSARPIYAKSGIVGWMLAVSSILMTLGGLGCLVYAALLLLP